MRRTDVIRWVIERMLAHEDSITQELALTVEREARTEWGGQRIDYIAKHCAADKPKRTGPPADPVPADAVRDYIAGRPLIEIESSHGINRRTLYRSLKRR